MRSCSWSNFNASGSLLQQVFDEIFKQKAARGDFRRAGQFQFAVILGEHRVARRFEKNDRRVVVPASSARLCAAQFFRLVQIADAEGRAAAAFALLRQRDVKAGGFQHFRRRRCRCAARGSATNVSSQRITRPRLAVRIVLRVSRTSGRSVRARIRAAARSPVRPNIFPKMCRTERELKNQIGQPRQRRSRAGPANPPN